MKKKITVILIMLFFAGMSIKAQTSYFDNNPKWEVTYSDATNYPCVMQCWYLYSTNGDTVINARTYKKIVVTGDCYTSWYSLNTNFNCSVGFGGGVLMNRLPYLRDSAHVIYGWCPATNNDTVLLDYNLHVGDTIPSCFANTNFAGYPVVVAIDSVPVSNFYRKRFRLSSNYSMLPDTAYLIEGIGSSFGLSEGLMPMMEGDFHLACYSLNDTTYYPHQGPSCNVTVGIKNIEMADKIIIYPNPASTTITIHRSTQSTNPTNQQLTITDVLGNVILSQPLNQSTNPTESTIDISHLSKGIYFYEVAGQRGKIVKQ